MRRLRGPGSIAQAFFVFVFVSEEEKRLTYRFVSFFGDFICICIYYICPTTPSQATMPSDQPARLTKKQKKATAFRERTGKGKGKLNPVPRRLRTKTGDDDDDDDDSNAVPAMEDQGLVGGAGDAARDTEGNEGRVKSPKKASLGAGETTTKKRRRREDEETEPVAKRARGSRKVPPPVDEDEEAGAGVNEPETRNEGGKQRLILFVGMSANLSCSYTKHQTERPVSKETSSILRRAKRSTATSPPAVRLLL